MINSFYKYHTGIDMIKLMDSSIRDGGNVNDWNFGKRVINGIIKDLVEAKMDIIELGYLKNVTYSEDKSLYNTVTEAKNNLPENKGRSEFSLMVQEDKWDWDKLERCDGSIKHIRVSFHKTDVDEGLELCKKVMDYGYTCHCNPINIMGYNDIELLELISKINRVNPEYFTIVDTFGSMSLDDLKRIESLLQNNLSQNMKISAHLHENLGLAYSLAQEFISYFESKRDMFIDASLFGIGRIPGNLCQELIMSYLIRERNADYDINPVYDAIDDFIVSIKKKNPWGYALPYSLSAIYNLHRTYPEYLMEKGKLRTKDIKAILNSIIPSERVIYNQKYIEDLYQKYIDVDADDGKTKENLSKLLKNESVMIVAPGKSIKNEKKRIEDFIRENKCIIISINFDGDYIHSDYSFYTNPKRYAYDAEKVDPEHNISTSNLLRDSVKAKYIVNYGRLSRHQGIYSDDSVLMLINLLSELEVKQVFLTGFDGFFSQDEHFDESLDNGYSNKNDFELIKGVINYYSKRMKINYITRSVYKND